MYPNEIEWYWKFGEYYGVPLAMILVSIFGWIASRQFYKQLIYKKRLESFSIVYRCIRKLSSQMEEFVINKNFYVFPNIKDSILDLINHKNDLVDLDLYFPKDIIRKSNTVYNYLSTYLKRMNELLIAIEEERIQTNPALKSILKRKLDQKYERCQNMFKNQIETNLYDLKDSVKEFLDLTRVGFFNRRL